MKIKTILLTVGITSSLLNHAQTLNDVWNTTKQTATDVAKETAKQAEKQAQDQINAAQKKATDAVNGVVTGTGNTTGVTKPSLTNDEVIKGLKEALSVGTNNSSGKAAKLDGYLKNAKLFIPWPAEAASMKAKLIQLGFQKKVTDFETSLNRAAEEAAKKAAPVFLNAITGMSIGDGFAILNGSDSAATNYLRQKTFEPLKAQFLPIIKDAIAKVKVTSYWTPLVTAYNKVPGVQKQNPDLNNYVCTKAINGLMLLILEEEAKIRKDPLARVTDTLKKVFGFKK